MHLYYLDSNKSISAYTYDNARGFQHHGVLPSLSKPPREGNVLAVLYWPDNKYGDQVGFTCQCGTKAISID
jgi:hypothetical protein